MKKTLSTMLIGTMLLLPSPVLASDDDDILHSLKFNEIEEEMVDRSPLIINAWEKVDEASDNLSSGLNTLKAARDGMLAQKPAGYTDGMKITDFLRPPSISIPELAGDSQANDQEILNYVNAQLQYLALYNFVNQLNSLQTQIESLEDKRGDMWKSWLQVEQGKDQAIWGAQQLFLAYNGLVQTKANLQNNVNLIQKQFSVQKLKEALGLVTPVDLSDTEIQIEELNLAIQKLDQSMNDIKGQLNIMLGQEFDTELDLVEPASVSQSKISSIDYGEDLEDALVKSYNVSLKEDSDEIEDAERSFTLAFHQAYQSIQDKKKTLDIERRKLNNEQIKYDQKALLNSLGLLSNLDFEGLRSVYQTQVNKVKTAEQELLKAYTAYNWMKEGLTVSTGSSSASTGASSSSSMGF